MVDEIIVPGKTTDLP